MIRLLCVEDDPLLATYLATRLGLEPDIQVAAVVPSATEAMGVLRREAVDVVLLDYRLQGADGLQLLGALQAVGGDGLESPKVLFCTGAADETFSIAARQHGAVGVVPKDQMSAQLLPAVRCVAEGGSWFKQ